MHDRDSNLFTLHLRTLTTGKPHPAAPKPATFSYVGKGASYTFTIQTCGKFLGVLFECPVERGSDSELLIWNWKTGSTELVNCTLYTNVK